MSQEDKMSDSEQSELSRILARMDSAQAAAVGTVQQPKKVKTHEMQLDVFLDNWRENGAISMKVGKHLESFVKATQLGLSRRQVVAAFGKKFFEAQAALKEYYRIITDGIRNMCQEVDGHLPSATKELSQREKLLAELGLAVVEGNSDRMKEIQEQLNDLAEL